MTYKVICKKVEINDEKKEMLLKKVKKLDRFFDDSAECRVMVSEQRENTIVEITILYKEFFFRAEARERGILNATDECMSKLDRQIRKNKTKLAKRIKEGGFENYNINLGNEEQVSEDVDEFKIIKTKKLTAKPMMIEEAVLQMNMLGHDFFIFANPESMDTNIVYRRKDGNYGLIEAD